MSIRGRVVAIDGTTLQLSRAGGIETTVLAPGAPLPATGDLVEVDPEARTCHVLTPWRGPAGPRQESIISRTSSVPSSRRESVGAGELPSNP